MAHAVIGEADRFVLSRVVAEIAAADAIYIIAEMEHKIRVVIDHRIIGDEIALLEMLARGGGEPNAVRIGRERFGASDA